MSLSSPRFRRRLGWIAALTLAVAGVAAGVVLLPKATISGADTSPLTGTADIVTTPKTVRLTPADRRAIDATLDRFVTAAVLRKNPGSAYDVATPALRGDTSRAEWAKGDLPVFPFPAHGNFHGITLTWSYPGDVGADLHLISRDQTAEIGAITYSVNLKRMRGRWLVDSFVPSATFTAARPGQQAKVRAQADFGPGAAVPVKAQARLGGEWFLLPGVVLGLLLLLVGAYFAVNRRRARLAERDYFENRRAV
jgi:hypothetical protein